MDRGANWEIREMLEKERKRGILGNKRKLGEGKKEGHFGGELERTWRREEKKEGYFWK